MDQRNIPPVRFPGERKTSACDALPCKGVPHFLQGMVTSNTDIKVALLAPRQQLSPPLFTNNQNTHYDVLCLRFYEMNSIPDSNHIGADCDGVFICRRNFKFPIGPGYYESVSFVQSVTVYCSTRDCYQALSKASNIEHLQRNHHVKRGN